MKRCVEHHMIEAWITRKCVDSCNNVRTPLRRKLSSPVQGERTKLMMQSNASRVGAWAWSRQHWLCGEGCETMRGRYLSYVHHLSELASHSTADGVIRWILTMSWPMGMGMLIHLGRVGTVTCSLIDSAESSFQAYECLRTCAGGGGMGRRVPLGALPLIMAPSVGSPGPPCSCTLSQPWIPAISTLRILGRQAMQ